MSLITKNGFNKKSELFLFLVNGDGGLAASRPMVTQTKHIPTDMLYPALLKSGIGRRWWKEVDCLHPSVSEFSCHDKAKNDLLIVTLGSRIVSCVGEPMTSHAFECELKGIAMFGSAFGRKRYVRHIALSYIWLTSSVSALLPKSSLPFSFLFILSSAVIFL